MRMLVVGLLLAVALPITPAMADDSGQPTVARPEPAAVGFRITKVVTGLDHPWDVKPIGRGRLLITERDSGRLLIADDGAVRRVQFPSSRLWVSGETGLMSLAIDPGFGRNHRFYTCQGGNTVGGGHDVRVITWRLTRGDTRARMVRNLLTGLPTSGGRHGGCRLLILRDGSLLVGTGDAAVGTNPQNLGSLGGKTLRLDRTTGAPWPGNPFADGKGHRRFVFTYGHRNVQGLAQRGDGSLWSVEHGSYRDDEVNRLVRGGNYGWNPVPGYNESVPMTDPGLPGTQVAARWSSGTPTLATSGAAFVRGTGWHGLDGTLAVACLKASRMLFLRFDTKGRLEGVRAPVALRGYGRLRSVSNGPGGSLLVTTDNGGGEDVVLRVRPR
jgi:glucose/arabinose dehydrogenase